MAPVLERSTWQVMEQRHLNSSHQWLQTLYGMIAQAQWWRDLGDSTKYTMPFTVEPLCVEDVLKVHRNNLPELWYKCLFTDDTQAFWTMLKPDHCQKPQQDLFNMERWSDEW